MDDTMTMQETSRGAGRARRIGGQARNAPPPPSGGAVYGLGTIGALVYFVGKADSGQDYLLAFGKAMVWPAILVYRALQRLGD